MKKNCTNGIYLHWYMLRKVFFVMKLTALIFLITSLSLMAGESYSQETRISLNMKNVQIKDVLLKIENNSEFFFVYNNQLIDVDRNVSINVNNEKISEVLHDVFQDQPVEFQLTDRKIVIVPVLSSGQQSQTKVSGKVTDSSGSSLPGVSVVVKGTTTGTISDGDGKYSLSNVPANATLQFSFVGMKLQEIAVGSKTSINVTLEDETIGLDEVVAIGYGVQKKSNVTGAIASVQSSDIQNRTTEDAGHAIQGKVAGVQVLATSGAPNATTSFRIRGYSNTGSSDPLYIVDGLKVLSINYLNSESIESIEILKDAASAAIYGAEAGNGVVLITTKKGKGGKVSNGQIFYNMQYTSTSQATKMDMMNAQQFKEYWIESGRATAASFGNSDTDWQDVMFGTGQMQLHTIGAQGNNENGSLYVALNYLTNNGMVVGDKDINKRVTAQVNASYKIKPWFTIGTTNSIERGKAKNVSERGGTGTGSAIAGAYFFDPTVPVVYQNDADAPAYLRTAIAAGKNVFRRDGKIYGSSLLMQSNLWNPLGMIDWEDVDSWRTNINGTVFGDFTPIKRLTITSRLGYRIGNDYYTRYQFPYYWNTNQDRTAGTFEARITHSFYFQWENYANYLFTLGKNEFTVMAGMQYARSNNEFQRTTTNGLTNEAPNYRYLDYSSPSANDVVYGNIAEAANISYFSRLSWTYNNRYSLQGTFRADAYDLSKLSSNNRWGYFPAVSGSWTVSNEQFMKNASRKIFSTLKVRASWGVNGNISSLNNYPYVSPLALGAPSGATDTYNYYYYMSNASGGVNAAYPSNALANPKLTWEESRQTNIGLDARFLKDRLTLGFDYYNKFTTNMLSSRNAPFISGNATQTVNAGKIQNNGLEFELSWKDKIKDFSYSINANLATVHNEVIESPYGATGRTIGGTNFYNIPITYFEAGYPIWYIRTFVTDHIDAVTGLPVYKTAAELGSDDGKAMTGSSIPDFTYGLTLNMAYKGFDLTVFGSGVQGNELFLGVWRSDLPTANLPSFLFTDRWTPTNTNAKYPKANSTDANYTQSDKWVFDASYFKIKQIQLGYTLPSNLIKRAKVSSLRVYGSLENFFTFTSYPGNDPESMASGGGNTIGLDRISYPSMKSVVFGINVSF